MLRASSATLCARHLVAGFGTALLICGDLGTGSAVGKGKAQTSWAYSTKNYGFDAWCQQRRRALYINHSLPVLIDVC